MTCAGYVDKSKRKPYRCGRCGRDIRDATHQPELVGMTYTIPDREPEEEDVYTPPPRRDPPQFAFAFEATA